MKEFFETIFTGCAWFFRGFVVLLVILFLVAYVVDRVHTRRFRDRFRGRYVLFCSPKRGWREFIENNVRPALPANVVLVWSQKPSRDSVDPVLQILEINRLRKRTPLLIDVTKRRLRSHSLHADFLPLKGYGKRDEAVQDAARKILEEAVAATTPGRAV